jgi:ribonuclease-3
MSQDLKVLQSKLGYEFKKEDFLIQALSHPSLNHKNRKTSKNFISNYERLEFFGDSILNMIISKALFLKYKNGSEGDLAKRRAHLICKDTICEVAKKFNIAKYIIMTEGEEKSGGRQNLGNIENTFEAICAAIYLDSNDLRIVESFILRSWQPLINREYEHQQIDPKSALQEYLQSKKMPAPIYKIISTSGESHQPLFTIQLSIDGCRIQIAEGSTKKEAEKKAAILMLESLK